MGDECNLNRSGFYIGISILLITVLIAGCSGAGNSGGSGNAGLHSEEPSNHQEQNLLEKAEPVPVTNTTDALEEMTGKIKAYKQAVESDQTDEAKGIAGELAGLWNAIQEEIKELDTSMYESLRADLEALLQGTQAEPWDKELLIQLDYKLYQELRDVKLAMENK